MSLTLDQFARMVLERSNVASPEEGVIYDEQSRLALGTEHQQVFEELTGLLAHVRLAKAQAYGEGRYQVESAQYDLAMSYSDLYRKMIRLKQQVFHGGSDMVLEDIIDVAADIAGYGVMLLQVVYLLANAGLLGDLEVPEQTEEIPENKN